jgi:Na+/proline symporter
MTALDWCVVVGTLAFIAIYGTWKARGVRNIEGYFRGGSSDQWPTIGLSIMATQASAITFLSTPGQAYEDGMRFVQFYFGLPIAMVLLSVTIVPIYYRLKVFTAYEYLEKRFDLKTRQLASFLFLVQRGLSTGITIYAPAIILSSVLGWSIDATNVTIGVVVILYTVSGGTRAVSQTQKQQMAVMLGGMAVAFVYIVHRLPDGVSFPRALQIAGAMGRMNVIDFSIDPGTRYTFWSGITGGLFLAMSYFGTDQSQVQRYLSGRSLTESRLGLLFNGLLKVPMQFFILLVGVMVFVFYQLELPPLIFNRAERSRLEAGPASAQIHALEEAHRSAFERKKGAIDVFLGALETRDEARVEHAKADLKLRQKDSEEIRRSARELITQSVARGETNDADYVFISFVMSFLPQGLIGLLLAVILCAAMSATASELTALGSASVVDFYRRSFRKDATDEHYLAASKAFTVIWGVVAILFATFASLVDNLIQAVNILGSIFYGTILGIFLAAFFLKRARGTPVFVAAIISQLVVVIVFAASTIGFLWYNIIGCALVLGLSVIFSAPRPRLRPL